MVTPALCRIKSLLISNFWLHTNRISCLHVGQLSLIILNMQSAY